MSILNLFIDKEDLSGIISKLNADKEIAFIINTDLDKWKAVEEFLNFDSLLSGPTRLTLWHIPGGLLPLVDLTTKKYDAITSYWTGWTQEGSGTKEPYFGPTCPNIIDFNICMPERNTKGEYGIPKSSFSWSGNTFQKADELTTKWWNRLKSFIKKNSVYVSRYNNSKTKPDVYAFSGAQSKFIEGYKKATIVNW